mmetsp:Transcript_52862/g.94843  ORF Transcript_52862/g.94843 Transcript_52862/m.94843 type:complete len:202 (+) Transcript_52862:668-1273(+)
MELSGLGLGKLSGVHGSVFGLSCGAAGRFLRGVNEGDSRGTCLRVGGCSVDLSVAQGLLSEGLASVECLRSPDPDALSPQDFILFARHHFRRCQVSKAAGLGCLHGLDSVGSTACDWLRNLQGLGNGLLLVGNNLDLSRSRSLRYLDLGGLELHSCKLQHLSHLYPGVLQDLLSLGFQHAESGLRCLRWRGSSLQAPLCLH